METGKGSYEGNMVGPFVAEKIPIYSDDQIIDILHGNSEMPEGFREAVLMHDIDMLLKMKFRNKKIIIAMLEIVKRSTIKGMRVLDPSGVYNILRHNSISEVEKFYCLDLNGAHVIIEERLISIGLVNRTIVHPREVFVGAIRNMACAVVLAHNHPSGKTEPSSEDIEITNRLMDAGKCIGIEVLDHIIFSGSGYTSMAELGIIARHNV